MAGHDLGSVAVNANLTVPMTRIANKDTHVATVTVTGLRWWMVRMHVAIRLISLAAMICPAGIEIEYEEQSQC